MEVAMSVNMPTHPRADWTIKNMMHHADLSTQRLRRLIVITALLILLFLVTVIVRSTNVMPDTAVAPDTMMSDAPNAAQHAPANSHRYPSLLIDG